MDQRCEFGVGRRQFVGQAIAAAVGFGTLNVGMAALVREPSPETEDAPNVHNMLVVGEQAVFLSHLPMFHRLDKARSEYTSPHRYQVILEASYVRGATTLDDVYLKDRREHPGTRIYTLGPEEKFVLSRLFPSGQNAPSLKSFIATVFRGHLEQGGQAVKGLERAQVNVTRVVHARKFDPRVPKPGPLEYIVFGTPSELFLAHAIFGPPDFDHIVATKVGAPKLTREDLLTDLRLVVDERKNDVLQRLRTGQTVAATLRRPTDTSTGGTKTEVQVGREFYFEEGELLVPPTFDPTPEERKAG